MNVTTGPHDPLRRSALTLHALPEEERRWMLDALPKTQVERLAPLLQELQALGIPRDLSFVPAKSECRPDEPPRWPRALDTRSAAALVQVLSREPHGVARRLLALRAWEWAPTLLAGLSGSARDHVAAQADVRPHGARFEAALLQVLEKHAHAQPERKATPARTPWQRIRTLVARRGNSS